MTRAAASPLPRAAPALLALLAGACGDAGDAPAAADRPNVLLITVDTLRADHLGPYGYGRPTSPRLDAFAGTAVVFEQAQSSAPWTLPALASVMTSYYTSTHGCWTFHSSLPHAFPTLAETLRDAGYDTACVVSHVAAARSFGVQQGFVHFDDEFEYPEVTALKARTSERVSDRGIRWIEAKAAAADGVPWLLWLHYFDPHGDYLPHAGISELFGTATELDLYDGEIRYTDLHVGRVLDALERTGLAGRTAVAFVADHGEEFRDHGGLRHGHTLHAELVRVPMLLRAPGLDPARVPSVVRTVDLFPTLLELCDVALPAGVPPPAGRSLVALLREGTPRPEPALAEVRLNGRPQSFDAIVLGEHKLIVPLATGARLYDVEADPEGLVDVALDNPSVVEILLEKLEELRGDQAELNVLSHGRWKLVVPLDGPRPQLYHVLDDPLEQRDLAAESPELVAKLQRRLERAIARAAAAGAKLGEPEQRALTGGEAEQLRGLGYLGGEE